MISSKSFRTNERKVNFSEITKIFFWFIDLLIKSNGLMHIPPDKYSQLLDFPDWTFPSFKIIRILECLFFFNKTSFLLIYPSINFLVNNYYY